jgi:hypothetical protein
MPGEFLAGNFTKDQLTYKGGVSISILSMNIGHNAKNSEKDTSMKNFLTTNRTPE